MTKHPFTENEEELIALSDMFPSNAETSSRSEKSAEFSFLFIYMAMKLAFNFLGRKSLPEVWGISYVISRLGMMPSGRELDISTLKQVASDLKSMIPGNSPQDIRLYSIHQKLEKVRPLSLNPQDYYKFLAAPILLICKSYGGKQVTTNDQAAASLFGVIHDSLKVLIAVESDSKDPEALARSLMIPISWNLVGLITKYTTERKLHPESFEVEEWSDEVDLIWDKLTEISFPHRGAAQSIDFAISGLPGVELRRRRLAATRSKIDRGFDRDLIDCTKKPFMACGLFHGERKAARNLVEADEPWNHGVYREHYDTIVKEISRAPVIRMAMPKRRYEELMSSEDKVFKTCWDFDEMPVHLTKRTDDPEDMRAIGDSVIFDGKCREVVYAAIESPAMSSEEVGYLVSSIASEYGTEDGADTPVLIQLDPGVLNRSSLTFGSCHSNMLALSYSHKAFAWLIEAAFFYVHMSQTASGQEFMSKIRSGEMDPEFRKLWPSFLFFMSRLQESSYFEVQIHGQTTVDDIICAHELMEDGKDPVELYRKEKEENE